MNQVKIDISFKVVFETRSHTIFEGAYIAGTLSSVLAWRIPGTGEPGGLPSMGSHRVGHD